MTVAGVILAPSTEAGGAARLAAVETATSMTGGVEAASPSAATGAVALTLALVATSASAAETPEAHAPSSATGGISVRADGPAGAGGEGGDQRSAAHSPSRQTSEGGGRQAPWR